MNGVLGIAMPKVILDQPQVVAAVSQAEAAGMSKHVRMHGRQPAGSGSAIVAGSDRALSFEGHPSVTIPPGAPVISDPVDLTVAPLSHVAVSLFLPDQTPRNRRGDRRFVAR